MEEVGNRRCMSRAGYASPRNAIRQRSGDTSLSAAKGVLEGPRRPEHARGGSATRPLLATQRPSNQGREGKP
jgi:hypothetical protein